MKVKITPAYGMVYANIGESVYTLNRMVLHDSNGDEYNVDITRIGVIKNLTLDVDVDIVDSLDCVGMDYVTSEKIVLVSIYNHNILHIPLSVFKTAIFRKKVLSNIKSLVSTIYDVMIELNGSLVVHALFETTSDNTPFMNSVIELVKKHGVSNEYMEEAIENVERDKDMYMDIINLLK